MRLLYIKPEVNNNWFAIYYPHYKKNNLANIMTKIVPKFDIERDNFYK